MRDHTTPVDPSIGAGGDPAPRWTVDRRIPLALIFAVALQCCVGLVGAGVVYETMVTHGRRLDLLEAANVTAAPPLIQMGNDIARITAQMVFLVDREKREDHPRP